MVPKELTKKLVTAPRAPGVYTFRDSTRKPLYIGKAANLHSRLSSYLRTSDVRITKMLEQARTVTWQETPSDIEALILESQLIKKHKPFFNIVMRDDKQYGYVGFSNENFSKVFITHQPAQGSSFKVLVSNKTKQLGPSTYNLEPNYIGPFTDVGALRTTLHFLRRLFPYCTCKQKHHVRCLNAHIGKCFGICCLKQPDAISNFQFLISKQQYKRNIHAIKEILSGKRTTLVCRLEKEMQTLGKQHRFEEAIALKTKIERIRRVFENAQVIRAKSEKLKAKRTEIETSKQLEQLQQLLHLEHLLHRIEGYDIAHIQGQHATGSMVVFVNGLPDKAQYRLFNIKTVHGSNDTAMLREMLERRMKHADPSTTLRARWPLPDLIVVDGGMAQLNVVHSAVAKSEKLKAKSIPIIALTKNDRHQGDHIIYKVNKVYKVIKLKDLPESVKNLILAVDAEAHRFSIQHYRKRHRKTLLKS